MALHSQSNAQVLIGDTIADRPNPQTVPTEGTIFHEKTTGSCAVLVVSPAGVHSWDPLCSLPGPTGPTGATGPNQWPNYVVSKGDPKAPFSTIQSAINAAVAAGHGAANPAVVLVHPGNYTENVTLHDGVSVIAFDQTVNLFSGSTTQTVITGNITCNAVESGNFVLNGFGVVGSITCAVALASLFLNNIAQTVAAGDMVSINVNGAYLQIENSIFTNNGAGVFIRGGTNTSIVAVSSFFLGPGNQVAIVFGANVLHELFACLVNGQMTIAANATLAHEVTDSSAFSIPLFVIAAGGSVDVEGGSISENSNGVSLISGSGSYTLNGVPSPGGFLSDNTIAPSTQLMLLHAFLRVVPASGAAFVITGAFDEWLLTPTGAATAALPDTRTVLNGQRITIKSFNGAFAITVNAAAGDTIDGAGSATIAAGGPPFHAITLQASSSARRWDIVSVV